MQQRIITRPDFDGVVCAVLLKAALGHDIPVVWAQPNQIQRGEVPVGDQDVVANLPWPGRVALWFDHHVSNAIEQPFQGLFRIAPSAAGLVYEYYKAELDQDFQSMVQQADKIDAAQLTLDEIKHPDRYPYILLSMTIATQRPSDAAYCDRLVGLLLSVPIEQVMADSTVRRRSDEAVADNQAYEIALKAHTHMRAQISISDFRGLCPAPNGNRFLVYLLFPEAHVNLKLFEE
ncbi:MAG: exopolyphosphatase, partial [Desulfatitalea sp.]|nr:exopolyphosphatase [Desulfatitalea sp.]NNJ99103.1 exopolyphosphatase [Desulfatitalea sp.]